MAQYNGFSGNLQTGVQTIIPISTQVTPAIPTNGFSLCGVFLPAAFTGTTLTFNASSDKGATWVPVKNTTSGTALSYTVAQGEYVAIDPKDFQGIDYLQIKSGSSEAAARTLLISLKGI